MINTTLFKLVKVVFIITALTVSTQAGVCKVLVDGYNTAIKAGITPSSTLTHQAKSCMTTGKPATPTYGDIERENQAKNILSIDSTEGINPSNTKDMNE